MRISLHRSSRAHRGRRIATYMLLAVAALASPRGASAQWVKVDAPGLAGVALYDTQFLTRSLGFAVGITQVGNTYVYKTTNGGSTWKVLKGLGLVPASFTFLDSTTGLAGGLVPGCQCMATSRTTDGGITWTVDSIRSAAGTLDAIPGYGVNNIVTAGESVGYGVGIYGTILKTSDRGATWARLNTGNTTDFVSEIWAASPDTAYAIAAPSIDSASYIFYRTTNGGATWERTYNFIDSAGFQEVCFVTNDVGFVAGFTAEGGVIYKTSDGGAHWAKKFEEKQGSTILGMEFENRNVGYAVGAGGIILRTADGGETWTREESGTTQLLPNVSIVDGMVFVVGLDGTVLRRAADASGVVTAPRHWSAPRVMPNPVTESAVVSCAALGGNGGDLVLYDALGRESRRFAVAAGAQSVAFVRAGLAPGTYLYRLVHGQTVLAAGTMEVR